MKSKKTDYVFDVRLEKLVILKGIGKAPEQYPAWNYLARLGRHEFN
ncbi:MAG: hypothetical protein HY877_05965 [Deltaproteobacteria bacterium]|nr:hypothetical protein [Deltaproteobacteria bacterium]